MSFQAIDRIEDLQKVLLSMQPPEYARNIMVAKAQDLTTLVSQRVCAAAPVGSNEPGWIGPGGHVVEHGRPSMRQHGMTLAMGWRESVVRTNRGVQARVFNIAPHARFALEGTSAHRISARNARFLAFWWGDPLRWPAKDSRPPGPRYLRAVNHPGAKLDGAAAASLATALMLARLDTLRAAQMGLKEMARPIQRFFGGA